MFIAVVFDRIGVSDGDGDRTRSNLQCKVAVSILIVRVDSLYPVSLLSDILDARNFCAPVLYFMSDLILDAVVNDCSLCYRRRSRSGMTCSIVYSFVTNSGDGHRCLGDR